MFTVLSTPGMAHHASVHRYTLWQRRYQPGLAINKTYPHPPEHSPCLAAIFRSPAPSHPPLSLTPQPAHPPAVLEYPRCSPQAPQRAAARARVRGSAAAAKAEGPEELDAVFRSTHSRRAPRRSHGERPTETTWRVGRRREAAGLRSRARGRARAPTISGTSCARRHRRECR